MSYVHEFLCCIYCVTYDQVVWPSGILEDKTDQRLLIHMRSTQMAKLAFSLLTLTKLSPKQQDQIQIANSPSPRVLAGITLVNASWNKPKLGQWTVLTGDEDVTEQQFGSCPNCSVHSNVMLRSRYLKQAADTHHDSKAERNLQSSPSPYTPQRPVLWCHWCIKICSHSYQKLHLSQKVFATE